MKRAVYGSGTEVKTLTFETGGISCTGCIEDIKTVLSNKDGIIEVEVDFTTGVIDVAFDPALTNEKEVFLNVESLGLGVKTKRA